jgi:hypothetical protein
MENKARHIAALFLIITPISSLAFQCGFSPAEARWDIVLRDHQILRARVNRSEALRAS